MDRDETFTRVKIVEAIADAIGEAEGSSDDDRMNDLITAEAVLDALENLGLVLTHNSQALRKMSRDEFDQFLERIKSE